MLLRPFRYWINFGKLTTGTADCIIDKCIPKITQRGHVPSDTLIKSRLFISSVVNLNVINYCLQTKKRSEKGSKNKISQFRISN